MTNTIKATTMNISLTAEQEQWVKDKVASGRYNSRSEVVREALRLLEDREQLRELKLQTLREKIQNGLESGPAKEWDVDKFIASVHRQYEDDNRGEE